MKYLLKRNILSKQRGVAIIIIASLLMLILSSCGGGGGDRAAGVTPGPPPPGGGVIPPPPVIPGGSLSSAEQIIAVITSVSVPGDARPVVEFQVTTDENIAVVDVSGSDVRFIIAKLQASSLGNLTGTWQSYINRIEQPDVGIGTVPRLQATTENSGVLTNNNDGTYSYRFATAINAMPTSILTQAGSEGLNVDYEPDRTHRVVIQFSNGPNAANPIYDFVPSTGATSNIFHYEVAATANCNRCHDSLALHGGGRVEVRYCVTCHNPGSSDSDSTNSVDFKQMIHKIHRGRNLPSVIAGGEYLIYGFSDRPHDYSKVGFPQDIRNCNNCHAGTATTTTTGNSNLVLTSQGDNWSEFSSRAVCGSCHDDVDFSQHQGGQANDDNCMACHSTSGVAGSISNSHRDLISEERSTIAAEVLQIDNTAQGQTPAINFRIYNPSDDSNYDILNNPKWTAGRLAITLGWSTNDYNNTGNSSDSASTVSVNALTNAVANGDGSFRVNAPLAIPDGSQIPNVAATGSGVSVIEGRAAVDVDGDLANEQIPLTNAHGFFSINETDAIAVPRRQSVELSRCQTCHQSLVLHGGNRSDNINSCVTCHNPRNTERDVRAVADTPPTDGKQEESLDFKTMIHGIHAADYRENPLQIVGFRGFSTHVFDEDEVHFPGILGNCTTCHTSSGFQLPLDSNVQAPTIDTGADRLDPSDDVVISPTAAVCSSCHDSTLSKAHMVSNGGNFATTQADVDSGVVLEQCEVCHASGRVADVAEVHPVR